VGNAYDGTLLRIETAGNTVAQSIDVGGAPAGVATTADGSHVFVVRGGAGNVVSVNASTGAVSAPIAVGSAPVSLGSFVGPLIDGIFQDGFE
jgi:YVTN family beta-propeller protein